MKKLNQYLLTHAPIAWNTKAIWVIPALLLLNLLWFLGGYASVNGLADIPRRYNIITEEIATFSVLLSVLSLICWLVFYFRNNALKSWYPVSWYKLIQEYVIVVFTSLLCCSFLYSYYSAAVMRVGHILSATKTDINREMNTVTLAEAFLPRSYDDYHISQSCEAKQDVYEEIDHEKKDEFSYLNYCKSEYGYRNETDIGLYTPQQVHKIVNRWLTENKRDSVKNVLNDYLKLEKKYGYTYKFDLEVHVAGIFSSPGFLVKEVIPEYAYDNNPVYISRISSDLSSIYSWKYDQDHEELFIILMYFALGIASLILSFRLTGIRQWLIGLVGAGVWCIVVTMFAVATQAEEGAITIALLLFLVFVISACSSIFSKTWKTIAALCLIWTIWSVPFVIPFIALLIEKQRYYTETAVYKGGYDVNWYQVNYINLLFIMACNIFIAIPLGKKWQSNPEQ